jgi:MFS family permease
VLLFFPFYIVFQAPMIALGRWMGARYFITFIVLAWALVMVGHGLVQTWHQMLALRCLLGIFEAGYFSMATYLLSTWYTRSKSSLPIETFANLVYRGGWKTEFFHVSSRNLSRKWFWGNSCIWSTLSNTLLPIKRLTCF